MKTEENFCVFFSNLIKKMCILKLTCAALVDICKCLFWICMFVVAVIKFVVVV